MRSLKIDTRDINKGQDYFTPWLDSGELFGLQVSAPTTDLDITIAVQVATTADSSDITTIKSSVLPLTAASEGIRFLSPLLNNAGYPSIKYRMAVFTGTFKTGNAILKVWTDEGH